ncbi:MAG: DUF2652 domain-containing protein, partial [Chloroflexi bacterium]|nr:DUF2652 domain-containing protein [Chloroflexota bacterium]
VLGQLTPTLTLSKLEGDAVFAYAPEARLPRGETVLELVEATYVVFRDRQEAIRRRTTCQCNACRSIPALDLKFIVHHGDFIAQRVAGIHELVGSDVNLIHRLSKNHVAEATGWRAYAMFTKAGLAHMGLRPEGMHEQAEAYEHLGDVQTHSMDLRARYQELTDARRIVVAAEEADLILTQEFSAPPPAVWEWLNDPKSRNKWALDTVWTVGGRPNGRTGIGAQNHCAHGKGSSYTETVLDWRPFEYVTTEAREHGFPPMIIIETFRFEPTPDGKGTRVTDYLRMPTPLSQWRSVSRALCKFMLVGRMKYDQVLSGAARLLDESAQDMESDARL